MERNTRCCWYMFLVLACSLYGVTAANLRGAPDGREVRPTVVLLGTGTPNPSPVYSGPSTAVLVEGRSFIFDVGPGTMERAFQLCQNGTEALCPENVSHIFLTHLHSDHTTGLGELLITSWVEGREASATVTGPPGTQNLTQGILSSYDLDRQSRLTGLEPISPTGWEAVGVDVYNVPQDVLVDDKVTITAFPVHHAPWKYAFGYRISAGGHAVVISGDTTAVDEIPEFCDGCDVLVHEVYSQRTYDTATPQWQAYYKSCHTSTKELGELAARAKPKTLVMTHHLMHGSTAEQMVEEVRNGGFDGKIVFGEDMAFF